MTGFGKSFAVMQMMAGIMLRWPEDDLVIMTRKMNMRGWSRLLAVK